MAHKFHNTETSLGIRSTVILEKIMEPAEIYAMCAAASSNGITAAGFAGFDNACKTVLKRYYDKGLALLVEDCLKTAVGVKGSFASLAGPWNPLMNALVPAISARGSFKNFPETNKGLMTPYNSAEGLKPFINTVYDPLTDLYDIATGTNPLSIGGINLTIDTEAEDEGVWFSINGSEYKCTITKSEALIVKAALPANAPAGSGVLVLRTRCGLGESSGLCEVTRRITHVAAA